MIESNIWTAWSGTYCTFSCWYLTCTSSEQDLTQYDDMVTFSLQGTSSHCVLSLLPVCSSHWTLLTVHQRVPICSWKVASLGFFPAETTSFCLGGGGSDSNGAVSFAHVFFFTELWVDDTGQIWAICLPYTVLPPANTCYSPLLTLHRMQSSEGFYFHHTLQCHSWTKHLTGQHHHGTVQWQTLTLVANARISGNCFWKTYTSCNLIWLRYIVKLYFNVVGFNWNDIANSSVNQPPQLVSILWRSITSAPITISRTASRNISGYNRCSDVSFLV